jgi:predicted dehydrogenase
MAESIRVGIAGAGWPGQAHARGYKEAGAGFKIVAVADLIPDRRKRIMADYGAAREYSDAKELVADKEIDVISVCLPTALHAPIAIAAIKAGKHVVCEKPPARNLKEAKQIESAATKSGKTLLFSIQRRFGGPEQASKQAIEKQYAGEVFHARASWMRTRGIPIGTGWFTVREQSGGGALIDLGIPMLDLAWHLMGQPKPISAFGAIHQKFGASVNAASMDVEDSAFALLKFEGGKTLELSSSWALNQPPQQHGTVCRIYGDKAAVDVYTPQGAVLYRNFDEKGQAKSVPLKPPRVSGHASLMRHFRDCIQGKAKPLIGPAEGVALMQMIEAIYKSAAMGKSVEIK